MKAGQKNRGLFLLLIILLLLLVLNGCATYSGFWNQLWERLGFQRPQQEQLPGDDNLKEEDLNDHGEPVKDVPRILNELEESVFTQINEYRVSKGLNTLAVDEGLVEQARIHSRNMGAGTVPFGHEGFQNRIRASGVPYRSAAENVAFNNHPEPVDAVVEGWIASETHRRNIEGNFDLTGVGVVKNDKGYYYFTQLFLLGSQ